MNEKEILIKVADTLNESVVTIQFEAIREKLVYKYKFLGFGFGRKKNEILPQKIRLYIRPASLRTMIRISKVLVSMNAKRKENDQTTLEWCLDSVQVNGEDVAKCIALAIHNQPGDVPQQLLDDVLDYFTSEDLFNVLSVVIDKLNIVPFMNTITSVKSLNILEKPMESPQKPEEIIASGEPLEALSNILGSAIQKS